MSSRGKFRREVVDGYEVGVYEASAVDRPTIVMVHGVGTSHKYYRPFAKVMQGDFHIIALDLPGFGTTRESDEVLRVDQLADVVFSFLNKHGLEGCVLLGHSMGTQVVVELAKKYPESCSKVMLFAPTINEEDRGPLRQIWRLLQDSWREPFGLRAVVIKDYFLAGSTRMLKTFGSMLRDDMKGDIKQISAPTLVVSGSRDPISPSDWSKELSSLAPNGEFREVQGGTHVFHYSHP